MWAVSNKKNLNPQKAPNQTPKYFVVLQIAKQLLHRNEKYPQHLSPLHGMSIEWLPY